jgi:streptogramin lyase
MPLTGPRTAPALGLRAGGNGVPIVPQATPERRPTMFFSSWLAVRPAKKPQWRKSRLRSRPSIEMLEDRTLLAASTATTLATSPNPLVFGQTALLAATVTPAPPATGLPSGTVSFYANGTDVGTGTLAPSVTEFPISTPQSGAQAITSGPDGNLWCTQSSTNRICRMTTSGTATEFTVPTPGSDPWDIAQGPDGNLWFTEFFGNNIGRLTPTGTFTEFPVLTAGANPDGIAKGPDGNLWFTEYSSNKIGRITTSGTVTEFSVSTAKSFPLFITAGPDGNLWFTEYSSNKIGRITTSGTITEFAIPTLNSHPQGIAAGPDGNLWFTEYYGNNIGRITTSGTITEFPVPTASDPYRIAAGTDGNMWFTEYDRAIGWITPSGTITEMTTPTQAGNATGITTGPDGNIWFAEAVANNIGRANLSLHTALLFTSYLPAGTDSMTATYNGDANFSTSTSAPVSQTVNKANSSTTVQSSVTPSVFGQAVTFTAYVGAVAPGAGTPYGTVTFLDGSTTLGAVSLSDGFAKLTISSLAVGAHSVTVSYSGDSNFIASTSAALTQTVNKSSTSTTVTSSLNPSVSGQAVTFTATISAVAPGAGTPTGTATFSDGRNTLGTSSLSGGIATFTTSKLSGGNHKITVTYKGDSDFLSSTSPVLTQTVKGKTSPTTTLAPVASGLLSTGPQAPPAAPAPDTVVGSGPPADPSVVLTVADASSHAAAKATNAIFAASHTEPGNDADCLFAPLPTSSEDSM